MSLWLRASIAAGVVLTGYAIIPARSVSSRTLGASPRCSLVTNAADTSHIYSYDEVQTPAVPSRSNPKPKWPGNMRETIDNSHSQAGERPTQTYAEELNQASVVAKFVVDTLGCMDFSTFTVVSATDSAFADEVRQILPRLRFTAGQQNGHKVRSWLEWKFLFLKKAGAVTPFGSEN